MKNNEKQLRASSRAMVSDSKTSEQASVKDILQAYKKKVIQQKMTEDEEDILQSKTENKTGLPDHLKSGIESLSGYSMDDVKVHYNSDQPAQLNALAYAQGTDIHVGPGQEKHLPHEAWHVVQQMQGRVQPTTKLNKINVNDDKGLEKEADLMGARIFQTKLLSSDYNQKVKNVTSSLFQLKWLDSGSAILKWDVPIQGVRWYYNQDNGLMYYIIENGDIKYEAHSGIENAKPRSEWVRLYGSDPLAFIDADLVMEDEIFSDSESDSEDIAFDGLRIIENKKGGRDLAEFDRVKFRRGKIYEDKLAVFDQSMRPQKFRQEESELIKQWIEKQVLSKVSNKLTVIQNIDDEKTIRCHEKTGETADVILNWFEQTRRFKLVVYGESQLLRDQLKDAVEELRQRFPQWRITAKLGDPRAREDHDRMHK